jgi:5-methylcytosine-specific restriction protein A
VTPSALPRACLQPGCPERAERGGRCVDHARQHEAATKQGNTRRKGELDRDWQRVRARYLRDHPLCERCSGDGQDEGRVVAATEVHHRVDRRVAPHLRLAWANLEALCEPCHAKETRARQMGVYPGAIQKQA